MLLCYGVGELSVTMVFRYTTLIGHFTSKANWTRWQGLAVGRLAGQATVLAATVLAATVLSPRWTTKGRSVQPVDYTGSHF